MSAKAKTNPEKKPSPDPTSDLEAIATYVRAQNRQFVPLCGVLRTEIDAALKGATSKIWHRIPVWFIDGNPIVGINASQKKLTVLFWNGQSLGEPALAPVGSFRAAQIHYTDASELDPKALRRWLRKAKTKIWDYRGIRSGRSRTARA